MTAYQIHKSAQFVLKALLISVLLNFYTHFPLYSRTFYVCAQSGNDGNRGNSPDCAWKTIANVKQKYFGPGDLILISTWSKFDEQLILG